MSEKLTPPPWAHPVTMYQVKCTTCGYIEDDYDNFYALADWDGLPDALESWDGYSGWQFSPGAATCPDCTAKTNPTEEFND